MAYVVVDVLPELSTTIARELPGGERGSFWPFLLGAVGFALLLLWS
ncbi:MAG TPA: hypothetical protein VFY20_12485 [Gemmatimonadales bacterium]|nr:hypothetical protein [Gemmatimonadales bacterium]